MRFGKWLDRQAMEFLALRSLRDLPGVVDVHYENQNGFRTCYVVTYRHPESSAEFLGNAEAVIRNLQGFPWYLILPDIKFTVGEATGQRAYN